LFVKLDVGPIYGNGRIRKNTFRELKGRPFVINATVLGKRFVFFLFFFLDDYIPALGRARSNETGFFFFYPEEQTPRPVRRH